ncbi:hypothetical protein Nos7524_5212 [Nostoc sp. PCC 7524]|uniref:hormogonium polysaccharide biosynthesis protein HpsA n=1 Tax=Nostoc sp. (strain ATCC 29411 / PCC 7524) TaxID=28072 RepID=UPI00029ED517|nr:hormogonium polysaccharide biosynthesis protein HpsA [Nostoc sp. PCC 7524]AFY50936.1 hypothetical protein Nos7524_5212 [Nostoc sp. PCC 7524]
MSPKHQLFKARRQLFKKIKLLSKQSFSAIKKPIIWLLRNLFVTKKRRSSANAGFVLPTVVMVALVVVLLTTAILFRSFERSKNASNVRVNETVLRAAAPALDRAKAKLDKLFQDPRLPRSTPSDFSLTQVINDNINEFTLGDETQLKLVKEFNSTSGIQDEETLYSAWKYPIDTDNDGKFDSFTLYGIYFRTPSTTRARSQLEARAQPMDEGLSGGRCSSNVATSADLVGSQGWYKVGGKLKRSIFVYTTNVPITDITGLDNTQYETFTGNKGFVSLEYQQDRERIPLTNNAVIYENDLEISPGGGIRINGRVFTNGNLLTRNTVNFYQVSSPYSCYYTEENSKILVAGNVVNTRISETTNTSNSTSVVVDFYKDARPYSPTTATTGSDPNTAANINNTNKTVPSSVYGNQAGFNDAAHTQRINRLVEAANSIATTSLPTEVQDGITSAQQADPTLSSSDAKTQQLTIYFKKRTRRVPYTEVGVGVNALVRIGTGAYDYTSTSALSPLEGSGDSLRPIDRWVFPFDPSNGTTETGGYAGIGVYEQSTANKINLPATDPAVLRSLTTRQEQRIGDRILVGNNLPQYWYDSSSSKFVSSEKGQNISTKQWDNNTTTRQRFTQANLLDDLGVTERDGFWEKAAAQKPTGPLDVVGGLRVVTGAGIYLPDNRTPASTEAEFDADLLVTDKVWPDSMPMGVTSTSNGLPKAETPYLKMRATAVYHYQDSSYDPKNPSSYQAPIACVATYYDPTNSTTAKNKEGLPDFPQFPASGRDLTGLSNIPTGSGGNSHNGVVYSASSLATTDYTAVLDYQAELKYPNGRWVNKPLKDALANTGNLSLSQKSAIDSAMCALKILDGTIGSPVDTNIPHGAIIETSLLDARQIKAIDKPYSSSATKYDLDIELRQPLEIRTTTLNLDLLRRKSKTGGEFLFPNSGIIYATRDDALPDASSVSNPNSATSADIDLSSKDFKLDPTRRPNGIMLINGSNLSRASTYKAEEKGLILATNLPVYMRGNFNQHTQQEFLENLTSNWSNFYTRGSTTASGLNPNFACRNGQFSTCTTGESWRPATVLADSITVLSGNFQLGWRNDGDYDLNDNYGNYPVGFDFNGDGNIDPGTAVTLDETAIQFDVNLNQTSDTGVTQLNETVLKADINGDGDMADTAVSINESNITATVAARLSGFWDNNFVTSRNFTDSTYASTSSTPGSLSSSSYSSYFNNFVTPVQRRVTFSEYVMEICPKRTITACEPDDWVVGYDGDKTIKANQLVGIASFDKTKLWAGTTQRPATDSSDPLIQLYPRRVAFLRYSSANLPVANVVRKDGTALTNVPSSPIDNKLVLDNDKTPVPLGIVSGSVKYLPFTNTLTINSVDYTKFDSSTNKPDTPGNTLWFRTDKTGVSGVSNYAANYPLFILNRTSLTGSRATAQPLLVPVLQIQFPFKTPEDTATLTENQNGDRVISNGDWFQRATATETNVVFAQGDTPSRPPTPGATSGTFSDTGELGGGLENFIRFLENWSGRDLTARGSFIQFKRSSYATAPWQNLIANFNTDNLGYSTSGTIFGYPQGYRVNSNNVSGQNRGRSPFYITPNRAWGYDVALLTQLPDLFSQRFTAPATNAPNEFYREVPRDDNWVKTLLCAAQVSTTGGYDNAASQYNVAAVPANTTTGTPAIPAINYKYAISSDQRPSCP